MSLLYRLPPEVELDLMFDSTDQQNREALLETTWRFHLDGASEEIFREEVEVPTETLQLDQMLQLNSQRRCWYEVPSKMMVTTAPTTPYDEFRRGLLNRFYNYNALTPVSEKYWPGSRNTDVWDKIISPEAFETNQIITGDGQKRKLFKFLQEIGWLTKEQVNEIATKRTTKQPTYLCLSRNPIDMLMISTNQSFTSCMSLESGHNEAFYMGLPGFICDPNRVLAFLTTGKLSTYNLCGNDIKHFRYIERAWQIATPFGFNFGKAYPNNEKGSLLKRVVREVLPLRSRPSAKSLFPVPELFWRDQGDQCLGYCDECSLDGDTGRWSFYSGQGGSTPFQRDIGFDSIPSDFEAACNGSGMQCCHCGNYISEDDYYSAEDEVWCERCYCARFSTCERCDETVRHEDTHHVQMSRHDEEYWCEHCAGNHASTCYHCGTLWAEDGMLTVEDSHGDTVDVCPDCQDRVESCDICYTLYTDAGDFSRPDNGDIAWCGRCVNRESPTECEACGEFTSEEHPCGCPIEDETQDELELESEDENALQPATA